MLSPGKASRQGHACSLDLDMVGDPGCEHPQLLQKEARVWGLLGPLRFVYCSVPPSAGA